MNLVLPASLWLFLCVSVLCWARQPLGWGELCAFVLGPHGAQHSTWQTTCQHPVSAEETQESTEGVGLGSWESRACSGFRREEGVPGSKRGTER